MQKQGLVYVLLSPSTPIPITQTEPTAETGYGQCITLYLHPNAYHQDT